MRTVVPFVGRYPTGFAQWLAAMDLALAPAVEIAIVGEPDEPRDPGAPRRGRAPATGRTRSWRSRADPARRARSRCSPTGRDRRPADRLCLSRLRVPPAGDRSRGAPRRSSSRRSPMAEARVTDGPVEPRPAATVVLLRPGPAGLEALLTHRPASMAFAPDIHVFPGGRVDPADGEPRSSRGRSISPVEAAAALGGDLAPDAGASPPTSRRSASCSRRPACCWPTSASPAPDATRGSGRRARRWWAARRPWPTLADDLDLRLRTDRLVPLSRWVTPPSMPRRFDARFFAATLPPGAEATFEGDEVAAHAWMRPTDALAAMAAGRLAMWLPTSTTLQQLEHARSIEEIRDRLAPGPLGRIEVAEAADGVTRIVMPAGGGVAGQPVSRLSRRPASVRAGRSGRPVGPGARSRAGASPRARGGAIEADRPDPCRSGPRRGRRGRRRDPRDPGARRSRWRTRRCRTRPASCAISTCSTPGTSSSGSCRRRVSAATTVALVDAGGRFVIAGDLDGVRGARSIPGPVDLAVLAASVARVRAVAPEAVWLTGHPAGHIPVQEDLAVMTGDLVDCDAGHEAADRGVRTTAIVEVDEPSSASERSRFER